MKHLFSNMLCITALAFVCTACGTDETTPSTQSIPETEATAETTTETDKPAEETGNNQNINAENTSTPENPASISNQKAQKIALQDAGFTEKQVSGLQVKQETDDGILEYEVEFYADGKEYSYTIDASSGEIRDKDIDTDDDHPTDRADSGSNTSAKAISVEEAKKIALKKVPGAKEKDIQIKREYDDGREIYEGSVIYKDTEYEFEIDARNGKILSWEEDSIYD